MNAKTIAYWISTSIIAFVMTASGSLALAHTERMTTGLSHLGYPPYFANLLGSAKLLGVCILVAPGLALFKEWVYAAFAIVVLSASYSHFMSGDGVMSIEPLVVFSILVTSYLTRSGSRRIVLQRQTAFH